MQSRTQLLIITTITRDNLPWINIKQRINKSQRENKHKD